MFRIKRIRIKILLFHIRFKFNTMFNFYKINDFIEDLYFLKISYEIFCKDHLNQFIISTYTISVLICFIASPINTTTSIYK